MKMRILPHQIDRVTGGRYQELHHCFLGVDITSRRVAPIHRNVYYVDAKDPFGRQLIMENTPAKCMYQSGEIFCLYDERIPLTEARLVHEMIHRIARRHMLFLWTSGLDTHHRKTLLNEAITEYLTSVVLGDRYEAQVDKRNLYYPYVSILKQVESTCGRKPLVEAYLKGNARFFRKFKVLREQF